MTSPRALTRAALAGLLLAVAGTAAAQPASTTLRPSGPKLVVVLVVDQLRTDYLDDYGVRFTGGLRRFTTEGAWFVRAAFPFLNTVTCAGHATIGTGALPRTHGMVLNAWYHRDPGRVLGCAADAEARAVSHSGRDGGTGYSAKRLMAPTLAEHLREQTGGRSVVISLKPRSAIMMAGQAADAVVWFDEEAGWSTSTAYTREPLAFVSDFVRKNPLAGDVGKVWERMHPPSAYRYEDDAEGERPPAGWTRTFPHSLEGEGSVPERNFEARWQASPFADEYLGRMAAHAVDALQLGLGAGVDFLGVSFSSLDSVGHSFGPRSHEVQDMLARLDLTIGRLLEHLDAKVGRDRYVVALSADHGVARIPEQVRGGGRHSGEEIAAVLNRRLRSVLGPGQHVLTTVYTDIYLAPRARDAVIDNPRVRHAAVQALRSMPGITAVFTGDELAAAPRSSDRAKAAAAAGYYPGRSGDLIIVPRLNWLLTTTAATTHGTLHEYDQRVPVVFLGPGVEAGRFADEATPADIAPTLAHLAGLPMPRADGRPLPRLVIDTSTDR